MASIADNFRGLPIEDLIVSPMVGMAKGQAKLNDVTWKYITEVAFIPNEKKGEPAETRAIDVEMNRVMTDGTTGAQTIQKVYSKVPMLPLVPLPSLAITKADINFTMEVQTSTMHKDSKDASAGVTSTTTGKRNRVDIIFVQKHCRTINAKKLLLLCSCINHLCSLFLSDRTVRI